MKSRFLTLAAGLGMAIAAMHSAQAAPETIKFAGCYDLTKSYGFVSPQIAQAARDYVKLVNLQGGIEGHPVEMLIQDHGNEPQRGIECYEK